jgi:hypothetical protein
MSMQDDMRRKAEEEIRQQKAFDAQAARLMSSQQREEYERAFAEAQKRRQQGF